MPIMGAYSGMRRSWHDSAVFTAIYKIGELGGADVGLGRETRAVLDLRLKANLRGGAWLTAFAIDAGSSAGNQIPRPAWTRSTGPRRSATLG